MVAITNGRAELTVQLFNVCSLADREYEGHRRRAGSHHTKSSRRDIGSVCRSVSVVVGQCSSSTSSSSLRLPSSSPSSSPVCVAVATSPPYVAAAVAGSLSGPMIHLAIAQCQVKRKNKTKNKTITNFSARVSSHEPLLHPFVRPKNYICYAHVAYDPRTNAAPRHATELTI